VHAFGYAAESGVREVVIPLGNGASTLSAYGIASGDVMLHHELERSLLAPFDSARLATAVADVRDAALAELAATGVPGEPVVEIDALMRYREQLMHSLEVPVPPSADGGTLLADFDKEYVRRYGEGGTAMYEAVEVFALRARVSVRAGIPTARPERTTSAEPAHADVYWPGRGWARTDLFRGAPAGTVTGPALVELAHTTVAVPDGASLSAGPLGDLRLKEFS
jgi:N-methylhydantoinase A